MTVVELLQRIKERLQILYGDRLKGVILYGSEARGDAVPDSDIDILCVLDGSVNTWKEIRATVKATYSLKLEYLDRMFHITPVSKEDYDNGAFAMLRFARQEGIEI
ncbi:MAG: nucleotidyltransferase domain-containing protein [bacterium]